MTAKKKGPVNGVDHTGICVSFVIFDACGRIAVHKRGEVCRDERGVWDTGSGSCEFGEAPEDAVVREPREEYGLTNLQTIFAGTRNVVREATKTDKKSHWVTFVYACLSSDVAPLLTPSPAELTHVLHPTWLFPETLKLLPLHSQSATHIDMALKALAAQYDYAQIDLAERAQLVEEERAQLFRQLAKDPRAISILEDVLAERSAAWAPPPPAKTTHEVPEV